MITENLHFNFGIFQTSAHIRGEIPDITVIARDFGGEFFNPLIICDRNTEVIAEKIRGGANHIPICTLEPGEEHKNGQSVENILRHAHNSGLGRDGTFIAVGGGVIGDLCAFAASIYMRGCSLALVSTTLLAMVDAGLGGKTGFNLFDIKNLAGTFYSARHVYMPIESLTSLPAHELKSGMAELIKTAILDGDDFLNEIESIAPLILSGASTVQSEPLARLIGRAARFKGSIVEEDPLEKGDKRILLNLGHSFGHALESSAGLGAISHGEAVAWGIARACDLGRSLGICPPRRADAIQSLLKTCGYETATVHPLMNSSEAFMRALCSDKKNRGGSILFIVPDEKSARPVPLDPDSLADTIDLENL